MFWVCEANVERVWLRIINSTLHDMLFMLLFDIFIRNV